MVSIQIVDQATRAVEYSRGGYYGTDSGAMVYLIQTRQLETGIKTDLLKAITSHMGVKAYTVSNDGLVAGIGSDALESFLYTGLFKTLEITISKIGVVEVKFTNTAVR